MYHKSVLLNGISSNLFIYENIYTTSKYPFHGIRWQGKNSRFSGKCYCCMEDERCSPVLLLLKNVWIIQCRFISIFMHNMFFFFVLFHIYIYNSFTCFILNLSGFTIYIFCFTLNQQHITLRLFRILIFYFPIYWLTGCFNIFYS